MEVCVIGGGFSGIISAKLSKDYNLIPTIFEKKSRLGGIWNCLPGQIGAWNSLTTNTHKLFMAFSDFPWPDSHQDYPTREEVYDYLCQYCNKHDLNQYFKYNSEVTWVQKSNKGYLVRWKTEEIIQEKEFDYIIVASGKYSEETNPFKSSETFKGTIIEGGKYRDPEVFVGKNVVSIGKSSTASDVALEASKVASNVTQIYKATSLCLQKYNGGIPYEFFYYRLEELNKPFELIPSLLQNAEKCRILISAIGNPSEILPEWELTEDYTQSNFVNLYILSEDYTNAISECKIKCVKGEVSHFYENGVVLRDGRTVEAEVVLLGTGYSTDYSYLSQEILRTVQYNKESRLLACVLYRSVFHPDLPNFCFVGNYVYGVLSRYEIEAELGIFYMTGRLDLSTEEVWQGIRDEEYIRTLNGLKQPYDHFNYVRDLMRVLKKNIDFDFIQNELNFSKGILLPQFIFMENPGIKDLCRQVVEGIRVKYPQFNAN
jgi:dimethylaniline monooxygenase (N-oxide forming)